MSSASSEKDMLDEPLLPVSPNSVPLLIHHRWTWYSWSHRKLWAVHLALFLSYSAVLTVIATLNFHNISCNPNDHIYCKYLPEYKDSRSLPFAHAATAPAREAITYDAPTLLETKLHDNPFVGEPRPELDGAWHDLLESRSLAFARRFR